MGRRYSVDGVYHINVQQYGLILVTDGKRVEVIAPQLLRSRTVGLCGNLDGETIGCVQSPGKCIMKPNLAAMSYMVKETNRCSVQSQFPGQVSEYQKELNACAKDKSVTTSLTPIFDKAMQENQFYGLEGVHGMNKNGKSYGAVDGLKTGYGMGPKFGGVSGGSGNENLGCLYKWSSFPRIASAVPENVSLLEKQGIPNKVGILVYLGIGRLVSTVYRTKKVAMPNKETET